MPPPYCRRTTPRNCPARSTTDADPGPGNGPAPLPGRNVPTIRCASPQPRARRLGVSVDGLDNPLLFRINDAADRAAVAFDVTATYDTLTDIARSAH